MPRLKSEGHQVFVIRSFTDPLHQITSALASLSGLDQSRDGEPDLEELIRPSASLAPERSVIFFLDQFEEFFTLLSEEMRKHFLDAIGRLVACETLSCRLVFALREDLLAEMSQLKTAIPEIFHHEYRLKRLSRRQAALAITGLRMRSVAITKRNS